MLDSSQPNTTIPGGAYIRGGHVRNEKHFGGVVLNANGDILAEFADDEENRGRFGVELDPKTGKVVKAKPPVVKPAEPVKPTEPAK